MSRISVIIPGAGKSERFGGTEKKTFAKLDGRPIFLRTVELFLNRPDVCQIILAIGQEDMGTMRSQYSANLAFMGVKLVEGGERRCITVRKAIAEVAAEADVIAVHDAARPCVTQQQIDHVFAEAAKSGAAILACPLTSTIKRVSTEGVIEETVDRGGLFEAQTPQVFRRDLLTEAYAQLDEADNPTDDALVLERMGHTVCIVPSSPTNLKITTKAEMRLAAAILKSQPVKPAPKLGAFEEAKW